jgi:hypothetical protein
VSRYDDFSTGDFLTHHIVILPPLAMLGGARKQTTDIVPNIMPDIHKVKSPVPH